MSDLKKVMISRGGLQRASEQESKCPIKQYPTITVREVKPIKNSRNDE